MLSSKLSQAEMHQAMIVQFIGNRRLANFDSDFIYYVTIIFFSKQSIYSWGKYMVSVSYLNRVCGGIFWIVSSIALSVVWNQIGRAEKLRLPSWSYFWLWWFKTSKRLLLLNCWSIIKLFLNWNMRLMKFLYEFAYSGSVTLDQNGIYL